jgi:hypothetical protein
MRFERIGKTSVVIISLVAILLIVIGIYLGYPMRRSGVYAIFLTNNQVYFGHIDAESGKTLVLKQIYYIQPVKSGDQPNDISLLKLGNELHGPEDMMEINRDQILFIEKLRPDGKVAKAIDAYSAK